ncbi:uncharacterized protein (DUF885 family) [Rhizomicrobium palustre]|uniref:Uncharacterized protein (DUF885 family) n=1 Tax=Rhizomicrobium palustre TaxID=189966 RepID=A0A846MYL2_9PROT|nr:uncharacterized protein (DUF885 family) [Rhizomicrobium palustre]
MLNRRQMLATTAAAAAVTLPGAAAPAAEAAKANALYETIMDEVMQMAPEFATSLGVDTGAKASYRFKLGARGLKARAEGTKLDASILKRLKAINRPALTGIDATNYDAVLYGAEQSADADTRFTNYGGLAGPYAINQLGGAYHDLPDFLDSQHPIETKDDADAFLARLAGFATALDEESEAVRHDVAAGVTPPDFVIAGTLKQMGNLRSPAADKAVMVASLVRRTTEKKIAGNWGADATKIVAEKVYPALDRQIALFESLKAKAVHDGGVWRLPKGDEYYAASLANQTTTNMSPAEVHKLGLEVVAECTAQIDAIMKANGLTKGTVGQRLRGMYEDKQKFVYPNTDEGKEKLIADLNVKVAEVQKRLPQYFATLPKAPVEIKRVPKYIESGAPGGYYQNATLDGKRPGAYYINLRDTAEQPSFTLPTLTYHEAIPGHHLQISIAQETDLPLIRRIGGYNAYVEGWALYAEQLAVEMGLYDNDPWGHIGQLHDAMFRGVRLVVDSGMHQMKWSREKALSYFTDTLGDPEGAAISEIERYCVWPGQACGYMVGKRTILKLRERAKTALGAKFDIKAFHDAVLKSGALPLDTLGKVIDSYIVTAKA